MSFMPHDTIISSNRFEALYKYASVGMLITDSKGEIVSANPFLQNMFGYNPGELEGSTIEKIIPQRFKSVHVAHREKYNLNPKSRLMGSGLNLHALKKDGTEFLVEVSLVNYHHDGEVFIAAFVNDISLRVNNQNEISRLNIELDSIVQNRTKELSRTLHTLELLNEKLETSLSYQKAILDNANAMLYVMNKRGIIKFFNPEAERITGYSADEVVNNSNPIIFHKPEEIEVCRYELKEKFNIVAVEDFDVLKEKMLILHNQSLECEYRKKDGTFIPVMINIRPITDKSNIITGYLGLTVDISDRKEAENKLLDALNKEKKLGEMKSRFVSMASHEFRTPLSTVLSSAYLIGKYNTEEDQPKREKHLNRIISSVNMLTDILNEFLSVGKIEEGKIVVRLLKIDLQKQIEECVIYMKNSLKKGQKINYHHIGETVVILDPTFLKNIMINLLSNAIKFSAESTEIFIESTVKKDTVTIKVKDSGIGIAEEDRQHLMERFFRGANATNIQGTGLGLHIVSKYVERMNGKIECESELNKGTTFNISFNPKLNKQLFDSNEFNSNI